MKSLILQLQNSLDTNIRMTILVVVIAIILIVLYKIIVSACSSSGQKRREKAKEKVEQEYTARLNEMVDKIRNESHLDTRIALIDEYNKASQMPKIEYIQSLHSHGERFDIAEEEETASPSGIRKFFSAIITILIILGLAACVVTFVAPESSISQSIVKTYASMEEALVKDDPAPAEPTPAPVEETPAPAEATPAPAEETPAPAEATPVPAEETPAPAETAFAYQEKVPADEAPAASEETSPAAEENG